MTIHINLHSVFVVVGIVALVGVGLMTGIAIALKGMGNSIGRGLGW